MKKYFLKITVVILVVSITLAFGSCSKKLSIDGEGMDWNLVFITDDSTSDVVYCSAEYKINYPDASVKIVDISCSAKDGKLIIMNEKTDIAYYGKYEIEKSGREPSYKITVSTRDGESVGTAEVSKVKLHDDSIEYNLIIVIDEYTLHFKSVED